MKSHNDFGNYRKMSEPFASSEEATAALETFFDLVGKARNQCHIADAHVIVEINVMNEEKEGTGISSAHFGNSLIAAGMCAWSLGQEQANHENAIRELMKGA